MSTEARFWAKVDRQAEDACWPWLGHVTTAANTGYGQFWVNGKHVPAHRFAFALSAGRWLASDEVLDHLCRNRACVNPRHLEIVTHQENILRGEGPTAAHAQKTECIRGHPLSGENLYVNPANGFRQCRECKRVQDRERKRRKRSFLKETT